LEARTVSKGQSVPNDMEARSPESVKGTVSKRSSPVKQPSQESQSRVVKGKLKQTAVIKEERWTSGVASSRKEDIPARSVIVSAEWYNCGITVGSAVQIKRSRLSSVYLNYLSRIPGHAASWCQNNL
jgi:hypothetical protein